MKASTWKWIAIAFIALSAFMAFIAWANYTMYLNEVSAEQSWAGSFSWALSLVKLENRTVLVNDQTVSEPAGSAYDFNFNIQYAGYIEVIVSSSTTSNTYVEISGTYGPPSSWHSPNEGWTYDSGKIQVGTSGTVFFPVVPGTVMVAIGNNANSSATATVTIVYYS